MIDGNMQASKDAGCSYAGSRAKEDWHHSQREKEKEKVVSLLVMIPSSVFKTNSCHTKRGSVNYEST